MKVRGSISSSNLNLSQRNGSPGSPPIQLLVEGGEGRDPPDDDQ